MKTEFTGVSLLTHEPFRIDVEYLKGRQPAQAGPIEDILRNWLYLAAGGSLLSVALWLG